MCGLGTFTYVHPVSNIFFMKHSLGAKVILYKPNEHQFN